MKNLLPTIFVALAILGCSCDTTEPPIIEEPPGRRDYVWEVDTIPSTAAFTKLIDLWGSDSQNLWAVGPSDESTSSLWYYNGQEWIRKTQQLSSNLQSIFGLDSSNIWVCDSPGGNIFHFDGKIWSKIGFYPFPNYPLTYLNDIWGPNYKEIYIVGAAYDHVKGAQGIVLKYDGINWQYLDIPEHNISFTKVLKSRKNNYLYLSAIEFNESGDIYKLFVKNGNILNEIYSGKDISSVNEINGEMYFCIGQKIYKHLNNELVLWKNFTGTQHAGNVYGRAEKDFFTIGKNWQLLHYNGIDLKILYETNMPISKVNIFERDVFILCIGSKSTIIHGKLKA